MTLKNNTQLHIDKTFLMRLYHVWLVMVGDLDLWPSLFLGVLQCVDVAHL